MTPPPISILQLPIRERNKVAEDAVEIVLDLKGRAFAFHAGQYIRVTLPKLTKPDSRGNFRDLSISSSPHTKGRIAFTFRTSNSGFKKTLLEMPIGKTVKVTGPFGNFILPDAPERECVFVAGGIGIAPVLSILRYASQKQLPHRIRLMYGNTTKQRAAYLSELEEMQDRHPNFQMDAVFGPIKKEHLKKISDLREVIWYVSGPPAMTDTIRQHLLKWGVFDGNIRVEEFLGLEAGKSRQSRVALRKLYRQEITSNIKAIQPEVLIDALDKIVSITAANIEGTITYANNKFLTESKFTREELVGQNHRILNGGRHPKSFFRDMWDTILRGKVWRGDVEDRAKDGRLFWVDVNIIPIKDRKGNIVEFIAIRLPISERKEAEIAKSEFVSLASHQLRTPLTGIEWTAELFAQKEKLTVEGKQYLEDIRSSAHRLGILVQLLLNISRIESGAIAVAPERHELVAKIESLLRDFQSLISKKKLSLRFNDHPDQLVAVTDAHLLEYLLQNIITNAIDYTPENGRIDIGLKKLGTFAHIWVKDTGIGIPKNEQPLIFGRFSRASNASATKPHGTGLGLYIAQSAANMLGGKIWFESDVGKGSTFYIEIPLKTLPREGRGGLGRGNNLL